MEHKSEDNCRVFFRIILPFNLQHKKLSLPLKFLKKYEDELGNEVTIRVPNGRVWKIQLLKENNVICLASGLNDFFQYYSIRYGHFLVFKYKNTTNFTVRILDRTTCEIKYPNEKEDKLEDDKSIEILRSNVYPNSSKEQLKKKRICKRVPPANRKDGATETILKFAKEHQIFKSILFDDTLSRMHQGSKKAAELAMNSKLENPSFVVLITKYCILYNYMCVPWRFASMHMRLGYKPNKIKVINSDGGEWIVDTKFTWRGRGIRLDKGWNEFYSVKVLR